MTNYDIISLHRIDKYHRGTLYKDEIAVFETMGSKDLNIGSGEPVFVNAYSYMLCLSGTAKLSINDQLFDVNAQKMFLMQPLFLFQFKDVSEDFHCYFLAVTSPFADKIQLKELLHHIVNFIFAYSKPSVDLTIEEKSILIDCINEIKKQINRQDHIYHEQLIQNALIRFYLETDNIVDRVEYSVSSTIQSLSDVKSKIDKSKYTTFQKLIVLVSDNYRKEHEVKFYADHLNVTVQYVSQIMRRNTGRSLVAFIRELLYSDARNMLRLTNKSIQQIAWDLNFSDLPSFSKFFKNMSGKSPLDYRKN
ncbi:MAG: helix-turn-helix domain-containing protein [Bacteroidaceae bacterium]|nr:helix-turn-helix domain-containing protein [Bacteroidaceae bacterium]